MHHITESGIVLCGCGAKKALGGLCEAMESIV